MNAYVMTADRVGDAAWLEVHPDDIVLIRSGDPERRPVAAVKLSGRLRVALGERPPRPGPRRAGAQPALREPVGNGGWPPEPPPDVDSDD